ncbi:MAG: hypothetical protein HZB16_16715 [Armatimonadetes bacterium]|nr:hypothetical protein [Armatimonadota bacterium]
MSGTAPTVISRRAGRKRLTSALGLGCVVAAVCGLAASLYNRDHDIVRLAQAILPAFLPALSALVPLVLTPQKDDDEPLPDGALSLALGICVIYSTAWCVLAACSYTLDDLGVGQRPHFDSAVALLSTIGQSVVVGMVVTSLGGAAKAVTPPGK